MQAAGLEVQRLQDLREDYVRTAEAWSRNLEARWDDAVKPLGEEDARAWRLSLASGALARRKVYLTQGPVLWFVSLPVQVALLEKGLPKTRPGYPEYVARTNGFFPLPPRDRGSRREEPASRG